MSWQLWVLSGVLVLMILAACGKSAEDCLQDLECVANNTEWRAEADVRCASEVAARAKYTARWTDGFLENKFSRVSLQPPEYKTLRFTGDKVEFQNGFGAWMRMDYACFYDPVEKTVVGVDVW